MDQPKVGIIILNWNGLDYTVACLNSLKKIDYENYFIILLDNNSENHEFERLYEKFNNQVKIIKNKKNFGFAKANNIGIKKAIEMGAEYCCILNNDTTVEKNFLSELVKTAQKSEDIGMVAPKMLKMSDKKTVDNLGITLTKSGLPFNRLDENHLLFCPSGGCALYKSEMLIKIERENNYFDSDFFAYVEDLDLGFRAILSGFKPGYSEDSVIYHKGSATTSPMSDFAVFHTQRNIIWMMIKNYPFFMLLKTLILFIITQLGVFLLYIKRKKLTLILKANFEAIKKIKLFIKKRNYIQEQKTINSKKIKKYIDKRLIILNYLKSALKR